MASVTVSMREPCTATMAPAAAAAAAISKPMPPVAPVIR
jgi:hypothetical protein